MLADEFAREFGGQAFVVNPPDVDEMDGFARITGWKNVFRESRGHPLNQKEVAQRYAQEIGKRYEEINLVVCHMPAAGCPIAAHRKGRMVDSTDAVQGDGPMAPTRCGAMPVAAVVKMCFSGEYTEREMQDLISKNGGFVDHLGTSDAREVTRMIEDGRQLRQAHLRRHDLPDRKVHWRLRRGTARPGGRDSADRRSRA